MRAPLSRRRFMVRTAAAGAALSWSSRLFGQTPATLANDPLRPQFHFLPPSGWMNDPNGPIVWQGKVHLFYQCNPHGADWGDISWGHAISTDTVHWRHLPVALSPQPGTPDSYGVFSGSAIADGSRCLAFFTGVERVSDAAVATLHGSPELREQQMVAIASDAELQHWTVQPKPVVATPPLQPVAGFRDPSVWREGRFWYMVVGSGVAGQYGAVLLFRATVPAGPQADWEYLHPLFTAPARDGGTSDTVASGSMFECPDFFELDGHHVLLYSTEGKVFWMTGTLDPRSLFFHPGARGVLDTGAYYAPKSMNGPHGERILWGWIPERRPKQEYLAAGWAGAMSLPRVLRVSAEGALQMRVAPAVDMLLNGPVLGSSPARLPGLAARLLVRLPAEGGALQVMAGDAALLTLKRVSMAALEVNGDTVQATAELPVTVYLDGSVVEIFFGQQAAHTVRTYPALQPGAGLTVTSTGPGVTFQAQAMRPISADRLTT